jgi:putative ABC transport system substrate-binding protein
VGRAQQPALPVIGFLGVQSADDDYKNITPFLQGLKESGYVEGQNVAIEYRRSSSSRSSAAKRGGRWATALTGHPPAGSVVAAAQRGVVDPIPLELAPR